MKFSIGDIVVLKQTGEEGHVAAYINDKMIEVVVKGTHFPVYIEEVDHPYLKWFTEKKKIKNKPQEPAPIPVEKDGFRKPRVARGIYLSFIPVFKTEEMEDVVDYLKVYLLNELPNAVQFTYDAKILHQSLFRHEGKLHGFGHLYLHNVPYADMNDQPRFHWQFTDTGNETNETGEGVLRIRPSKLFEHISDVLSKNEPSFSYLLMDDFVPKKKPERKQKLDVSKPLPVITSTNRAHLEAPRYEIDLHIEELIDDPTGMSNAEIIKMQLDVVKRYVQLAIVHKQERMIIIHGLGKGKLKDEVHKILKRIPEIRLFTNEWQGRYGFGATEVFFKY